ncbi:MAG: virulence RhuM family protein [Rickettsiales bacterium]|nr:virulence RhuM family protein [Rickettsiales bacterium]
MYKGTAYLDFAELQARNHQTMHMSDWVSKLDEFLKLTGHEVLQHSGVISHRKAVARAIGEYNKYKQKQINFDKSWAEVDFENSLKELEDLGRDKG